MRVAFGRPGFVVLTVMQFLYHMIGEGNTFLLYPMIGDTITTLTILLLGEMNKYISGILLVVGINIVLPLINYCYINEVCLCPVQPL